LRSSEFSTGAKCAASGPVSRNPAKRSHSAAKYAWLASPSALSPWTLVSSAATGPVARHSRVCVVTTSPPSSVTTPSSRMPLAALPSKSMK